MNKKEEKILEKALWAQVDPSCIRNRRNCAKYWKGTTYDHWMVMSQLVWKLASSGWEVITEAVGKNQKWRADVVAINGSVGQIIEVLHSETDEKFEKKKSTYPKDFILRKVKTSTFNINEFDI